MEGYELVTSDDKHLGRVVGASGGNVIVEHGHLRKSRHAVPEAFVEVHDSERVVRTTLSKELIEDSPKLDHDGDVDEAEIAAYYGLESGDSASPDESGVNPGVVAAEQERAEIKHRVENGGKYGPPGRQIIPPNSHEVGGREYD